MKFARKELQRAAELVHSVMLPTPQYAWPLLNQRAGLAIDCMAVALEGPDVIASKTMFAGKLMAKVRLAGGRLQVVTVRSNVYNAMEPQAGAKAEVQSVTVSLSDKDKRFRIRSSR